MNLKTQYLCLGLLYSKKYMFDRDTGEVFSNKVKTPLKGLMRAGKLVYRFYLGKSERIEVPVAEANYLFYYGIFDEKGEITYRDGDPLNVFYLNLVLSTNHFASNDIKKEAQNLYARRGCSYAEIGRRLGITRHQARKIIRDEFGDVLPRNVKFINT